jgi:hypothetical protein
LPGVADFRRVETAIVVFVASGRQQMDIGAPETEREIEIAPLEEPVPVPAPSEQPAEEPIPA